MDRLEFGDGHSRWQESSEHQEHLFDSKTGRVTDFISWNLRCLKN